jgi:RNA polymerase sigma-54 factor
MAHISLHQSQTQQQIFTPQMQQALAMLQAPALELRAMIQKEIAQNPVLEEETAPLDTDDQQIVEEQIDSKIGALRQFEEDTRALNYIERHHHRSTLEDEERRQFFFDSLVQRPSLAEHLREQLLLSTTDPALRKAGEFIIGNLDDDGYLHATLEEIAQSTNLPIETAEKALNLIKTFHPSGIAARNLQECLLVQLERLGKSESIESDIVANHLDDLGHHRYQQIARSLGVSVEKVQQAAQMISTLEPRPGRAFKPDSASDYVVPEIFVTKKDGQWQVTVNDEGVPKLKISNEYKDLLTEADHNDETRSYLREKIRSGKALIQHINQRQETIRKIAEEIFRRQEEFLEEGITKLRPLTLAEVAAVVGVHETTVSRAVANKYAQTPQGLYELKFFFTPGYRTADGDISNKTVKEMLAELIAQEHPKKPLSDEKIVQIFAQKGIHLARRTVAKYRAEMKILPTSLRRKR